jgi:hypothetical protein
MLNEITAFLVTVIVCTFFLVSIDNFGKTSARMTVPTPERAMLQLREVPDKLPAPLVFVPEPLCVSPEREWALIDGRSVETAPVIPDRFKRKEKSPFQGIIVRVAGRYQVDPHLIQAIIFAESGYNPKAKSKKGALGLMQLMPSTAKALGVQDIYDPAENIDGGVRYFRLLLDRFDGDVRLALAAYNAGSRHVRNYEGIPPFKATQRYIQKVLKFRKKFKMETASLSRRLA